MTTPAATATARTTASDTALLAAVRAGEATAYAYLYHRHRDAARRLARALAREPSDADDLVSEAFARVLAALRAGGGPAVAFRAYLLTAVRRAGYDRGQRDRRLELTGDPERAYPRLHAAGPGGGPVAGPGGGPCPDDPAVARLERVYAARAFAKLPERWRRVLWHTEVEGERPRAVAPLLGLTPNAVAVLATRARERLRQLYLQEHLRAATAPACRWASTRLGAYVRHGLPTRARQRVAAHLTGCDTCRTLWQELAEVDACLSAPTWHGRHTWTRDGPVEVRSARVAHPTLPPLPRSHPRTG